MLTIENKAGIGRVTLVPADGYVAAHYERITGNGSWLTVRRTEMRAEWDRAVELAEKIVNAPAQPGKR